MRKKRRKVKNTRTTTRDYLLSEHWEEVKRRYSRQDEVCEICGTPHWHKKKDGSWKANRMFVWHHRHYNTVGNESREDLLRICKRCHDMCHSILRMKNDCDMVQELKDVVNKHFEYHPTRKSKNGI